VKVYFTVVIAVGMAAVAVSLWQIQQHPPGHQWYTLAALTLISGSATVSLPSVGILISVSETFVFFSVLLFGPAAGTVIVALDALVMSFWVARRRPEWYRPLFNIAAPATSFWIASHVLFATAGIEPLLNRPVSANQLIVPLAICAFVYFGLNSWFITIPTAFHRRMSPLRVWADTSALLSLSYFFGAALALLLVLYTREVNFTFVGVLTPLLLVSYLTYKTTVGRMEDATRHLEQVNRMYLSTIETLAMAIDAKDQVTHGHIRRVQTFAVSLAKAVGIREEKQIKAIEAAALLHDMGKLVVPEYILNKPGKLTPAEYEKMKLHAGAGADILSSIDFPYPVVPIVRHHHENWDGSGYPDKLRGTEIPIGARILAIVDCFDALTSDRPYRPRLSGEEAIQILLDRRGVMYDPMIVDTFLNAYDQLVQTVPELGARLEALDRIAIGSSTTAPQTVDQGRNEVAACADRIAQTLSNSSSSQLRLHDASEIITKHLRAFIPGNLYVFYVLNTFDAQLEGRHAVGEAADAVRGLRIDLGQRLTGWVAAHRQTICNSDPVLDLGETARITDGGLRSCLSTPLDLDEETIVGVLSIYSNQTNAFTEDHRRMIEASSRQIALTLRKAVDFDRHRRDELNESPNAHRVEQLVSTRK
jgi:putative nucleotidyltransferase with HDIG domain